MADDGVLGEHSLAAIHHMEVNDILFRFYAERLRFYTKLTTFSSFGRGWVNRVADNLIYAATDN